MFKSCRSDLLCVFPHICGNRLGLSEILEANRLSLLRARENVNQLCWKEIAKRSEFKKKRNNQLSSFFQQYVKNELFVDICFEKWIFKKFLIKIRLWQRYWEARAKSFRAKECLATWAPISLSHNCNSCRKLVLKVTVLCKGARVWECCRASYLQPKKWNVEQILIFFHIRSLSTRLYCFSCR